MLQTRFNNTFNLSNAPSKVVDFISLKLTNITGYLAWCSVPEASSIDDVVRLLNNSLVFCSYLGD